MRLPPTVAAHHLSKEAYLLNMREKKPGCLNSDVYSPYLAAIFCVVLRPGGMTEQGGA